MNSWFEQSGPQGDIVISSRIRLARNIERYPFPCKLSNDQKSNVINDIKSTILNSSDFKEKLNYVNVSSINKIEAQSLVEHHLVSPEFINDLSYKGLILSEDKSISIMINEEDHIRLQVMSPGFELDNIYNIADKLDSFLDKKLSFSFDNKLGYLTQCPTNLGTGMRASVMLHLPALSQCGAISRISSDLIKLGLTIRGIYGEGSEPKGDIYQLSNQITLGISEKTALQNLKDITAQLISRERKQRSEITKNIHVIDAICRSRGILKNTILLSNDEFMKLMSNIRLGVSIGIVTGISFNKINELLIKVQPATLIRDEKQNFTSIQRDQKRAKLVRKYMNEAN